MHLPVLPLYCLPRIDKVNCVYRYWQLGNVSNWHPLYAYGLENVLMETLLTSEHRWAS